MVALLERGCVGVVGLGGLRDLGVYGTMEDMAGV